MKKQINKTNIDSTPNRLDLHIMGIQKCRDILNDQDINIDIFNFDGFDIVITNPTRTITVVTFWGDPDNVPIPSNGFKSDFVMVVSNLNDKNDKIQSFLIPTSDIDGLSVKGD